VVVKDDNRQITAVFAGSSSGYFLPPQLIYEVTPIDAYQTTIVFILKTRSNEHSMKELFSHILRKIGELKLSNDQLDQSLIISLPS